MNRHRDDRGWVTIWTVGIAVSLFVIIAFTLDAGRVVRANSDAYGTAAAAARIAVNQIDEVEEVETGNLVLLQGQAVERAQAYCTTKGYECAVDVDPAGLTAEVTATTDIEPHMPGMNPVTITVHASAEAIQVAG